MLNGPFSVLLFASVSNEPSFKTIHMKLYLPRLQNICSPAFLAISTLAPDLSFKYCPRCPSSQILRLFFSSILHANKTHLQTKRFCTKTRFEIEAQANWLIDLSVSYRSHLFSSLGHTKFRATIKIAKFSGNFK